MEPALPIRNVDDDPPPFMGEWRRVYVAVAVYLAVLITSLYVVTRELSY